MKQQHVYITPKNWSAPWKFEHWMHPQANKIITVASTCTNIKEYLEAVEYYELWAKSIKTVGKRVINHLARRGVGNNIIQDRFGIELPKPIKVKQLRKMSPYKKKQSGVR